MQKSQEVSGATAWQHGGAGFEFCSDHWLNLFPQGLVVPSSNHILPDSVWCFNNLCDGHRQSQSELKRQLMVLNSEFIYINWRDKTYFDSGFGYRTCCWNVSQCQKQPSGQWNCISSWGWCNLTESFLQIIEFVVMFKKGNLSLGKYSSPPCPFQCWDIPRITNTNTWATVWAEKEKER